MRAYLNKHKKLSMLLIAVLSLYAAKEATYFTLDQLYPIDTSRAEQVSREVYDRDSRLIRAYLVEDGTLRLKGESNLVDAQYTEMLLAFEDKRFYEHDGVDWLALTRAAWQRLKNGRVISGGSTITMQVAKLLEPKPRTLKAKVIEMFRAKQLEAHFSKSEILSLYFTLAPYGGNLEGVRAASLGYLGRLPQDLTLDEAALLVALPQSPETLRPDRYSENALRARNKVLNRIANILSLDDASLSAALSAPVPNKRIPQPLTAMHFTDRALAQTGSSTVITTLDSALQQRLESIAAKSVVDIHDEASIAILVVENDSREILGYVGSAGVMEHLRRGFVDMVQGVRSPGSTLKPFIYGMAFDEGLAQPATMIRDVPRDFNGYAPTNFYEDYRGQITMQQALQQSLNVPAVAVLERVGPVRFHEIYSRAGMTLDLPTSDEPGLAIALGGVGTTLEDLVAAYVGLSKDGEYQPLKTLKGEEAPAENFIGERARLAIKDILLSTQLPQDQVVSNHKVNTREIAYKTGTSYGFRDAWAIGFNDTYTIGVWIGRADGTPIPGRFGSNTAAPVLFSAFDLLPMQEKNDSTPLRIKFAETPALKYFDKADRYVAAKTISNPAPSITYPRTGSVIDFDGTESTILLEAEAGKRPLFWFVDGEPIGSNRWARNISWNPSSAGFYEVSVVDSNGQRSKSYIEVKP